jgi:murein L,D-transpeptidase YafK
MIRRFAFLCALLLLGACATTGPHGSLPPASGIAVVKSERLMYLLDQSGQPYRTYKIALGGNPVGPKQCEGDQRTPEGLYMIETRNPDSKYHLSLKISYPNPQDIQRANAMGMEPGNDIFIHGVPNDKWLLEAYMYRFKPEWTQGCIAVSNRDIEELWTLVADGTPIEILP